MTEADYFKRDLTALQYANVTIYTDPDRARKIEEEIAAINRGIEHLTFLMFSRNKHPFEYMGGVKYEIPEYIKKAIIPLDEEKKALWKEFQGLVDKEATAREKSKRLQEFYGVDTM